jgi:hypothetical protein
MMIGCGRCDAMLSRLSVMPVFDIRDEITRVEAHLREVEDERERVRRRLGELRNGIESPRPDAISSFAGLPR